MANKTFGLYNVTANRKVFESNDGSHLTSAAYEFTKGEFIRATSISEQQAADFNLQSHNSRQMYFEVTDEEVEVLTKPKRRKA